MRLPAAGRSPTPTSRRSPPARTAWRVPSESGRRTAAGRSQWSRGGDRLQPAGGLAEGMRLIVRRVRPSGRPPRTSQPREQDRLEVDHRHQHHRTVGYPGSHQLQWLDALARHHAVVEDRVRTDKAMGLRNLPSKTWTSNRGWILATNVAARPGRLAPPAYPPRPARPGTTPSPRPCGSDLPPARPPRPACPASSPAHRRDLALGQAFASAWHRLDRLPASAQHRTVPQRPRKQSPSREPSPRSDMRRPTPTSGTNGAGPRTPGANKPLTNRG